MSSKIEFCLSDNRYIYLVSLKQAFTYEGLLNGLPTTRLNKGIIESALKKATSSFREAAPYLIPPIETPIIYRGGTTYPFGDPASIPGIMCEATFKSISPARDKKQDYSWLNIVWFQDSFALPIAPDVIEHIISLDWNRLAHDDEY